MYQRRSTNKYSTLKDGTGKDDAGAGKDCFGSSNEVPMLPNRFWRLEVDQHGE